MNCKEWLLWLQRRYYVEDPRAGLESMRAAFLPERLTLQLKRQFPGEDQGFYERVAADWLRKFDGDMLDMVPLTPLQDIAFYMVIKLLGDSAEEGIRSVGLELPSRPLLGTLPTPQVNGIINACDDGYLVRIHTGLFQFFHWMSIVILTGIREAEPMLQSPKDRLLFARFADYGDLLSNETAERFLQVMTAYASTGDTSPVKYWGLDFELHESAGEVRSAMELFVVAHEYAHAALGHLSSGARPRGASSPSAIVLGEEQELEADLWACMIVGRADRSEHRLAAGVYAMRCLEVLERAVLLLGGRNPWGAGHPPASRRRQPLQDWLKTGATASRPEIAWEAFESMEKCEKFGLVLEHLWCRIEPKLKDKPLAPMWNPAL